MSDFAGTRATADDRAGDDSNKERHGMSRCGVHYILSRSNCVQKFVASNDKKWTDASLLNFDGICQATT